MDAPKPTFSSLAEAFAYFTERQLETFEGLNERARPPKGDLNRADALAKSMVEACAQFGVNPYTSPLDTRFGRLRRALDSKKT